METIGANEATSGGTQVTTGGANSLGSWVSIGTASVNFNALLFNLINISHGESALIDIAVGTQGNIVAEGIATGHAGFSNGYSNLVHVDGSSGNEVWVRGQSTRSIGINLDCIVHLLSDADYPTPALANEAFGLDRAASKGTLIPTSGVAHTKGIWVSLGTLGFNWDVLLLSIESRDNSGSQTFLVDVGLGAGPTVVAANIGFDSRNNDYGTLPSTVRLPVDRSVWTTGSEIFLRMQSTQTAPTISATVNGYSIDNSGAPGPSAANRDFQWAGNLGNLSEGSIVHGYFNTRDENYNAVTVTGLVVEAFRDAEATGAPAGIGVAIDAGGTGSHRLAVNTTGWIDNASYNLIATAGTFGGKSMVGMVIAQLTLNVPVLSTVDDFFAYPIPQPTATVDPAETPTAQQLHGEIYARTINSIVQTTTETDVRTYDNAGKLRTAPVSKVDDTSATRSKMVKGQ